MASTSLAAYSGPIRLLAWPLRHIRWKIVLPYAILTVLLAIAGSFLFTKLITGNLSERFQNQLAEAGKVVSDDVVRKEREHLEIVRSIAFTEGVGEALTQGDAARLTTLAEPIAANAAMERVELLDSSGRRITTLQLKDRQALVYGPIQGQDNPAEWPLVQRVLQGQADPIGDKHAQIVRTSQGFVLYTAGPVFAGDKLVGAVLVGTTLETFTNAAKSQALADITIYDFEGAPLASTFPEPQTAEEGDLHVAAETLGPATEGTTIREKRTLFARQYDLLYGRLKVRDQVVGLYSVALNTDFIFDAGAATRTRAMLIFGVGMAAVLAIGLYITHQLTKPILRLVTTAKQVSSGDLTIRSGVSSYDEIGVLASSFDEMTDKLQRQHLATIRALTSAIDARDPYTMGHSMRVGQLSMMMGAHLGMDETTLSRLEVGGYLHDIGKIGIRDAVLLKPGRLTPEERQVIEEHPQIGLAILEPVELPKDVIDFVRAHHERLDGSGYPSGLSGDQVPMVARIAAVADMYDAVTTHRPYREPMSMGEAMDLLRSEAGRFLDPRVVLAMAAVVEEWEERRRLEPALRGFRLPEVDVDKPTVTV